MFWIVLIKKKQIWEPVLVNGKICIQNQFFDKCLNLDVSNNKNRVLTNMSDYFENMDQIWEFIREENF